MVVGVTNEPESLVEKTVEKNKMRFPIAMVDTPEEANYGIRGFPSSFLVGVDGDILWSGHPGGFEREFGHERLESELKRASVVPPVPEEHARALSKHAAKREYGKLWAEASELLVEHPEDVDLEALVKGLEAMVEARLADAKRAEVDGAWARALAIHEELADAFEGIPGTEDSADLAKSIGRDKDAKDDLAAAKKLESALEKWREGEFERALKALESVAKKYGDTPSGERAQDMLARHDA